MIRKKLSLHEMYTKAMMAFDTLSPSFQTNAQGMHGYLDLIFVHIKEKLLLKMLFNVNYNERTDKLLDAHFFYFYVLDPFWTVVVLFGRRTRTIIFHEGSGGLFMGLLRRQTPFGPIFHASTRVAVNSPAYFPVIRPVSARFTQHGEYYRAQT